MEKKVELLYTLEELREAMRDACPTGSWKDPIDVVVREEKRAVTEIAIEYYTGSFAESYRVEDRPGFVRVCADGYYGLVT